MTGTQNSTPASVTGVASHPSCSGARLGALSRSGFLTVILFGASGDLAKKKTFPALFNLFRKGLLPRLINIVGYGRSMLTPDEFDAIVSTNLLKGSKATTAAEKAKEAKQVSDFLKRCTYIRGSYDADADFQTLHSELQKLEQTTLTQLGSSGASAGIKNPQNSKDGIVQTASADHPDGSKKSLVLEDVNRILYMAVPPSQFLPIARMASEHLRVIPKSSECRKVYHKEKEGNESLQKSASMNSSSSAENESDVDEDDDEEEDSEEEEDSDDEDDDESSARDSGYSRSSSSAEPVTVQPQSTQDKGREVHGVSILDSHGRRGNFLE